MRAWSRWGIDVALVVAAVLALVVLTQRAQPGGIEIERREAPGGLDEVRVEVAGAVARPGVVTVAPGSRVGDAIALAGGATAEADTGALNLARRVTDEERLVVPRQGERRTALLDLNRASAPQLEALPGIGRVTAEAILAARERQPFASSDELLTRGLTSARVYEQVRDLVTAR
jgi:competence protein ComEA